MGYSISQATHDRITRYRGEDRLCQGSGRCSSRATFVLAFNSNTRGLRTSPDGFNTFVCCKKHTDEMLATYDFYGYLFANDRDARIWALLRLDRDERGEDARDRALRAARGAPAPIAILAEVVA